jgi:hypothetical protein
MRVFYYHLQLGLARDEALRRAKLRLIRSDTALADPHYWAVFVMTGDALRPMPQAVSWRTVGIWLLTVAIAVSGAVAWQRRRRALRR